MRSSLCVCFCFLTVLSVWTQQHDQNWYFGRSALDNPLDSLWGTSVMQFGHTTGHPEVYYLGESLIDYDLTNVSMSDAAGNFIFTYNGTYIEDASGQIMQNGNDISSSGYELGDILPQGGLALAWPEQPDQYLLLHQSWDFIGSLGIAGHRLAYSMIDMTANGGLGTVALKNQLVTIDTMDYGKIAATRHANGRDWWIVVPKFDSNQFLTLLFDPAGLHLLGTQTIGSPSRSGLGQAAFSPNGAYYATTSSIDQTDGQFLNIYHFDRCTGLLSHPLAYTYHQGDIVVGLAFSPHSQLLYHFSHDRVYQYRMDTSDILASRLLVAERDDYVDMFPPDFTIRPTFFLGQLAPDGKIYINSIASTRVLHVIEEPDRRGSACHIKQHDLQLPTVNTTLPLHPHYRLGPLDGSECDSLGLDNIPVAKFYYWPDSADAFTLHFKDLSYYAPTSWNWTFGEGQMSQDKHVVHQFPGAGTYEVCLQVSNENGDDMFCQMIQLGPVTITEAEDTSPIQLFPNPVQRMLTVDHPHLRQNTVRLHLYNASGVEIQRHTLSGPSSQIDLSKLPVGFYVYQIIANGRMLRKGKLIKIE